MGTHGATAAVDLYRDVVAKDPAVVGTKAACLARAAQAGFPVAAGFVVPVGEECTAEVARDAWAELSGGGQVPLVVRSSSMLEDAADSSMAGRFCSRTNVIGWEPFVEACREVRGSVRNVSPSAPMAVLVQRQVESARGGVLFGVDPVTGARDHLVVESLPGSPVALVSGTATAERLVMSRRGRRVRSGTDDPDTLGRHGRRRLARLGIGLERMFAGPQDVEWAIDPQGRLWLLQSRPVTAVGEATGSQGPVLGPGPVGETFPDPLSPLEQDLFLEPMRLGMVEALRVVGVVPCRRIEASPVLVSVGGRVAADLELLGWSRRRRRGLSVLNPIPSVRRLIAAWHVGRLRACFPPLVEELVGTTDESLRAVPALATASNQDLISLLVSVRQQLVAVHGHQILAGMLLKSAEDRASAAALAMPAVAAARAAGVDDDGIVARLPVVLTLVPPRVGPPVPIPPVRVAAGDPVPDVQVLAPREALRLRARWLDELAARAAWELARRLEASGRLASAEDVRFLRADDLALIVDGGPVPDGMQTRRALRPSPPLPASFRLTPSGGVVPQDPPGRGHGRGAGGGRGAGPVRSEGDVLHPGDVLVVRVLSPSLAPELPGLAGLVSETGSTLSHLAIVARELGVPTAVAVPDATRRFRPGETIVVDGRTGEVAPADLASEGASR
ncbi:MAG: PEP/pyruvate-binding domain-containing protein [Actinomycetota bacterium]